MVTRQEAYVGKGAKKRQQDLKRRLQQGGTQDPASLRRSREELAAELGDPARFAHCLTVFCQLALLMPDLHPCRYPAEPFVKAVLEVESPSDGDPATRILGLRRAIIPTFVDDDLLGTCQAAIQAAMERVQDRDLLLGLTAAGALSSSCQQDPRDDHPFWELLFEISLTEALLSGHFLIELVLSQLASGADDLSPVFARSLSQGDSSRVLGELGLAGETPAQLAACCARVIEERDPYHLQFDAVLRLAQVHVRLAETVGREIAQTGLTPELKERVLASYEEAYAGDMTDSLVEEVLAWLRGRLEVLRDDPDMLKGSLPHGVDEERRRGLGTYLALRAIPRERNPLLRAIHVQSLVRSRTQASELETEFLGKLWSQPTEIFALEEYEKFLLEKGEVNRSRRVRTYLKEVQAAKKDASSRE